MVGGGVAVGAGVGVGVGADVPTAQPPAAVKLTTRRPRYFFSTTFEAVHSPRWAAPARGLTTTARVASPWGLAVVNLQQDGVDVAEFPMNELMAPEIWSRSVELRDGTAATWPAPSMTASTPATPSSINLRIAAPPLGFILWWLLPFVTNSAAGLLDCTQWWRGHHEHGGVSWVSGLQCPSSWRFSSSQ